MATKKTIELNGILTEVWQTDASAQQIDDAVAKKTYDLSLGKIIPSNANLDTYLELGSYYCPNSSTTATLVNPPATGAGFKLVVEQGYGTSHRVQKAYFNTTGRVFWRYYVSSWTQWLEVATTDKVVPLDGSKTMTGDLTLEKTFPVFSLKNTNNGQTGRMNVGNDNTVGFYNRTDDNNTVGVYLKKAAQKSADAFCVSHKFNGTTNYYTVLHTGNKPSGTYTGNGSATSRTISVDGIGDWIAIKSNNGIAILSNNGVSSTGSAVAAIPYSAAHFTSGTLTLATTDALLNANGVTYYYQVL